MALPLEQVGPVHTRGDHVDDDLVDSRLRILDLTDRQNVDSAGTLTYDSSHAAHGTRYVRTIPAMSAAMLSR